MAFTVAVAAAVTLTGPLALFNPWLVSFEQARHAVPERLAVDQAAVDRVTASMLRDLFLDGEFTTGLDDGEPLLDERERSHMADVGGLVRTLVLLDLVAIGGAFVGAWALRRERQRRGRLLVASAAVVGGAALVVALIFAVAFDDAFLAFHRLFFREGTYLFGAGSDLIRLFPEPFWFELSLAAGASIVISALAVAVAGWRAYRALPHR